MSMLNPFLANDALNLASLILSFNTTPLTPTMIGDMGLFEERGTANLTSLIEELTQTLGLIAPTPRNAPGTVVPRDLSKIHEISIPHLIQRATIMADSVQGIRQFGTEDTAKPLEMEVNDRLTKLRRQIDYTIEYHRLLALEGKYMDRNGDIKSGYTLLGGSRDTVDFVLGTANTALDQKCMDVLAHIEDGLDGVPYTGVGIIASTSFWRKFISHAEYKKYFANTARSLEPTQNMRGAREFCDFQWFRYRGSSAVGVPTDKAFAFPMGVPDMYLTRFAPANYVETVNTVGLPYYAKSRALDFEKGVEIEGQSNVLNVCTRPTALVELTTSN